MSNTPFNIEDLVRPNILNLVPYSSARSEFNEDANIFLDANENPFETGYNRYPDPLQKELKKKIGKIKDIPDNSIFIGNGSDEAIDLLIRIFCIPRLDEILLVEPTYGMYMVSANINNIDIIRTQLMDDFTLDAEKVLRTVTSTTKIIFLCSPNNPSGNSLDTGEIEKILNNFHGIVVIDEAYIDFSKKVSWTQSIKKYEKLVVLQTMSKAWGLAGLRVGMAFSNPRIIDLFNKVKPPYNLSSIAQEKVLHVIQENQSKVNEWVDTIIDERKIIERKLEDLSYVEKIYPSDANFILVKVSDPYDLYNYLVKEGIIVRNRDRLLLCEGCLRITIGRKEENEELLQAMNHYIQK